MTEQNKTYKSELESYIRVHELLIEESNDTISYNLKMIDIANKRIFLENEQISLSMKQIEVTKLKISELEKRED